MFVLFVTRFAYIEFTDKESVDNAVTMDDSLFKGRQIKVHYPEPCSNLAGLLKYRRVL